MNETRKLELCKNVFNTFLVAWMGAIAYIFVNFETLSATKIILGVVGEIFISILLFIIARIYVLEERQMEFVFLMFSMLLLFGVFVAIMKIDTKKTKTA